MACRLLFTTPTKAAWVATADVIKPEIRPKDSLSVADYMYGGITIVMVLGT